MPKKPVPRKLQYGKRPESRRVSEEVYHVRNVLRGRRWRKLRAMKLGEQPLCEQCEQAGRISAAMEVDHITPSRGDAELHFDYDNLQSLCCSCHARKTKAEQ